jgi:subtilisin-like proprotein convertase family protein
LARESRVPPARKDGLPILDAQLAVFALSFQNEVQRVSHVQVLSKVERERRFDCDVDLIAPSDTAHGALYSRTTHR